MKSISQCVNPNELKKHVRWGTLSVLEFRMGYNASTVPESGGPPVGLIGRPIRHSYSMIPIEDSVSIYKSKDFLIKKHQIETMSLSTGCSCRHRNEFWLDPLERVRILAEQRTLTVEDIGLICHDVRATLESRAFSRLDDVNDNNVGVPHADVSLIRCGDVCRSTRPKVLLY
ncbi:uncharacterized protein PHALS_01667 [Plasmopara halstedii]|uniref:Uncharacterized protein n=1 Tax=Plasmopara halstedii TaxID=4781 RepID=A0A0P1AT19_PLAHL|nr:uncharacterized protein PHALS_01667 [Plasmopara halstedii]CEG45364.1 hypothetical protein PHALS_01667 [Plasmopara halstedii]|eukprot:XP_024581733.1 hypothetical protein PHALS_01667 [Plasmopara halstedii]